MPRTGVMAMRHRAEPVRATLPRSAPAREEKSRAERRADGGPAERHSASHAMHCICSMCLRHLRELRFHCFTGNPSFFFRHVCAIGRCVQLVVCLSKACKHDSLVFGVQNQPCTFCKLKIDSTKVHSIAPSQGQVAQGGIQRALGVCHYLSPLHHLSAGDPP